jgi:hypothetical protein
LVIFLIAEVAQFFGYFFPRQNKRINYEKNMGWATFWVVFSQAHLVTPG